MRQSLKSTPPIIGDVASFIRPEDYLTMAWDSPAFLDLYFLFLTEFWQFCEDIFKIIIRPQIIQLGCFWNTVYHRTGRCSFGCIVEHPVFLAEAKGAYGSLRGRIIDRDISIFKKCLKIFSWLIMKFSPWPVLDFGGTAQSLTCCFTHAKNSSTSGRINSCRFWSRSSDESPFNSVSAL